MEGEKNYKVPGKWTDDCQGKKDFDSNIISISTRYWPERDYTDRGGKIAKPNATSSLYLHTGDDEWILVIEEEFQGENEDEVKLLVESWAQDQMDILVKQLKMVFNF